ncbi:MAG TPA: bis(5'-nucleosyl)-tetraphosphatase (symmetrical) YqeK [Chroococcales cyanobacterium]
MTQTGYKGIPSDLTLDKVAEMVEPKVSRKRFGHIEGVAKVAKKLAEKTGCDPYLAELAGLLHDTCKEVKDIELVAMARKYGLKPTPVEEQNGHLLHGPVSACYAREHWGVTNQEVLDAISEHTLGAVDMSTLSKVVFLADCLEESRPKSYTDPIWQALEDGYALGSGGTGSGKRVKDHAFKVNLDAAMLVALNLGLQQLVDDDRTIHPKTVDVRNWLLLTIKTTSAQKA